MRRGTTTTLSFTTTRDLSGFETVVLTIRNKGRNLDFWRDRLAFDEEGFSLTLTQEETLSMAGTAEIQVRAVSADGVAVASDIAAVDVDRILKDGVL